jgi:hypothetical protein
MERPTTGVFHFGLIFLFKLKKKGLFFLTHLLLTFYTKMSRKSR